MKVQSKASLVEFFVDMSSLRGHVGRRALQGELHCAEQGMAYITHVQNLLIYPPTPTAVERVETTLKYNHDNYSDYNYDI